MTWPRILQDTIGFSQTEKSILLKVRNKFPEYEPTCREKALMIKLTDYRVAATVQGTVLGATLGMFIAATFMKRKDISFKILTGATLQALGTVTSSVISLNNSLNEWRGLDKDLDELEFQVRLKDRDLIPSIMAECVRSEVSSQVDLSQKRNFFTDKQLQEIYDASKLLSP